MRMRRNLRNRRVWRAGNRDLCQILLGQLYDRLRQFILTDSEEDKRNYMRRDPAV